MRKSARAESGVIQYLRGIDRLFMETYPERNEQSNFYRWLLKNGKTGKTRPFTKRELAKLQEILSMSQITPQATQCYYVAQMLLPFAHKELKYFEGYACHIIPVEHAWLEYKGKILDLVWATLNHNKSPDGFSANTDNEYFGIEIPHKFVTETIQVRMRAAPLLLPFYQDMNEQSGVGESAPIGLFGDE